MNKQVFSLATGVNRRVDSTLTWNVIVIPRTAGLQTPPLSLIAVPRRQTLVLSRPEPR